MSATMGTCWIDIEIENPPRPGDARAIASVLVDTGAELSWVPGEVLEAFRADPKAGRAWNNVRAKWAINPQRT